VLPAICTEERIVLGAELEDGTVIKGQNDISHPPGEGNSPHVVDKSAGAQPQLVSPIRRVFYLSKEGCARVRGTGARSDCLVYTELLQGCTGARSDCLVYTELLQGCTGTARHDVVHGTSGSPPLSLQCTAGVIVAVS
jgi:hypothetical protein